MPLSGSQTFVGFGFGAIQSGLLLYEAFQSGAFRRLVVGEVVPDVVSSLRRAKGCYTVNIAHADRIAQATVGPVEIECPAEAADRERLIEAVASSESAGTAVPSVDAYATDSPGSLHRILAEGLRRKAAGQGPRMVVYAAENHNHAAEILQERVASAIPAGDRASALARVRFLNTVIGKMSGLVPERSSPEARTLAPVMPGSPRAFLVEAFNRILVSRIRFDDAPGEPPYRPGITVFEEKSDLLPFEEAKLYGHNATHALAGYLGSLLGIARVASLRGVPGLLPFLRAAFLDESGEALIRKYAAVDPLFTRHGYRLYADDLLERMTNPHLLDTVERVTRDPARKLAWEDRLIGTMRLAMRQGVTPRRYAMGAAAAAVSMDRTFLDSKKPLSSLLVPLWSGSSPDPDEQEGVLGLTEDGRKRLQRWRDEGYPELEGFLLKT
jgi:mannitol-1-phosphate 5-dehydrogenase